GCGFRGFPGTAPGLTRKTRRRVGARGWLSGRESLALPASCDLRRIDQPIPWHFREGQPGRASRWAALVFDHCETISDRNIERVKALGGGIAIQHRMAFQGEYFVDRYGAKAAQR